MVASVRRATSSYVPERGDIVWLNFDPQAGHEQAGKRPALTLSPKAYNDKIGLALFCPITSKVKGYPFEVAVHDGGKIKGVVLCDQIKSADWRKRQAQFISKAAPETITDALRKLRSLLG